MRSPFALSARLHRFSRNLIGRLAMIAVVVSLSITPTYASDLFVDSCPTFAFGGEVHVFGHIMGADDGVAYFGGSLAGFTAAIQEDGSFELHVNATIPPTGQYPVYFVVGNETSDVITINY